MFVHLVGERAMLDPDAKRDLSAYHITKDLIKENDNDIQNAKITVKITFKRSIAVDTVNTFLPSVILILLSYMTVFFKLPKFFNTAITVNLSVMLTMTYLLISVLKKLPPTPYIKWIEYWLIFAQMVPFIKAVLITSIQWLMENAEENQTARRQEGKHDDLVLIKGKLVWVRKMQYQLFPILPPDGTWGDEPKGENERAPFAQGTSTHWYQ